MGGNFDGYQFQILTEKIWQIVIVFHHADSGGETEVVGGANELRRKIFYGKKIKSNGGLLKWGGL